MIMGRDLSSVDEVLKDYRVQIVELRLARRTLKLRSLM